MGIVTTFFVGSEKFTDLSVAKEYAREVETNYIDVLQCSDSVEYISGEETTVGCYVYTASKDQWIFYEAELPVPEDDSEELSTKGYSILWDEHEQREPYNPLAEGSVFDCME